MTPRIRRMVPGDVAAILTLEREAFGADAFSRRQLRYLLLHARAQCLVATRAGEPIGYGVSLLPALPRPARIYTLVVAPSARGLGVARRLCARMIDTARRRGYDRIRLEVSERNAAAAALYTDLGFRNLVPLEKSYYADGSGGWRMQLELGSR